MIRMPKLIGLAAVCAMLAPRAQVTAQAPAPGSPERGTPLLAVDFVAVANDGAPVPALKPEDVTLKINGRARPLRSLQLVSVSTGDPAGSSAPELPSPFGSNATSERGRTLSLVVENDSFRPGREAPLRQAVDRLIAGLGPRDLLSLTTIPYGGVKVPLTTDHSRVRTALSQLVGQAPANESGSALACRTRRTLESLTGYFNSLGVRDAPTVVMIVTAGMAGPRRDATMLRAPGMCELSTDVFQQVGVAAAAPRTQVYVIQPEDILPGAARATENIAGVGYIGSDNPMEGLEHLAGVTGGKLLRLTGSTETALSRVLRESSAYYLASVDGQRDDWSGRPLSLDVRSPRSGVEVRHRATVTFAAPVNSPAHPARPSPRDMIKVATVFRDLPLRAGGYSAPEPDGKGLRVIALAEPIEPDVKLSALVAALFDRDGRLVANWVARPEDLERPTVMGAMLAAPGAYRLRVAAVDATGRSGTADYDVDAELAQTGALRLSSIVLGLARDGGFVPKLQFAGEPVAIGYMEMHGAAPGARLSAALELADTLNGPSRLAVPLVIKSSGENRYIASGALPIGGLPPGDYVVRAIVGLEGQPATRVVRTLRKVR
jgi:hypothetical protein